MTIDRPALIEVQRGRPLVSTTLTPAQLRTLTRVDAYDPALGNDPSNAVRDTVAWTLSKITEVMLEVIDPDAQLNDLVSTAELHDAFATITGSSIISISLVIPSIWVLGTHALGGPVGCPSNHEGIKPHRSITPSLC